MARKVFVSFLGTNNYLNTHYKLYGEVSKPVRFIQDALIDFICKEWTENDLILIFCTGGENGSEKLNWFDNGHTRFNESENLERVGLQTIINNKNLNAQVSNKIIPEGFSEDEIWNIFDIVYKQLEENDEIYFDVTHAFRSIPMFSTVLFNYAHFMKNTHVKSVLYGAFEKLGPAYKVKEMDLEKRVAPVIDLSNMIKLQEYSEMASSLITFGRVNRISDVLKDGNDSDSIIKQICEAIENFDNYIVANRMSEIKKGKIICTIKNNVKAIRKTDLPIPIKNVIRRLGEDLKEFVCGDSNQNIEAAINWAVRYKMLPQAYTMGQEYIISLLFEILEDKNPYQDKEKSKRKKKFRMFLSSLCAVSEEDIQKEKLKDTLSEHRDLTYSLLKNDTVIKLRKYYPDLSERRNAIDHAKGNVEYKELEEKFVELYSNCIKVLKPNVDQPD